MSAPPTAAVIGAGSSGIAAAKALHERGIPFTVFEASDRVGGNAYVDHFGVRDRIRFETKVTHARRGEDGVWELELGDRSVERFDALLVANGHHWDARWPEPMFPGHETFAGTQMHAHDYGLTSCRTTRGCQ